MPIEQKFVIVCESAIVENNTNNISLLTIFDVIQTDMVPVVQPRFSVVTKFEGGEGEHDHRIVIRAENRQEIARLDGRIIFSSSHKAQYVGTFINLDFPRLGQYFIEIYLDEILQPIQTSLIVKYLEA